MSELLTAANTIAPVITTAAAGFAGAVVQSAQNQAADGVVQRGRALVGRLLERRPEDPRDVETDTAVAQIQNLSEGDRLALDAAVGKWLDERFGDRPSDLRTLIEREAEARGPAEAARSIQVNATGEGSVGIGYVHNLGGLNLGGRSRGEPGERSREAGR
ncbi:hypothetical protein GCM10022384_33440 [Streptomyces marokkonensis]|uniref:Uncharacterized protein n=1 Tax=Streptomyces marokkonensis TaxID=324855 RepID=A0ABP7QFI2_9ACTN